MDATSYTCRIEGCGGPASGICINKLSFDDCPDVVPLASDIPGHLGTEHAVINEVADASGVSVSGAPGDSLDAAACDRLLRATGATLVGIVAGPSAGKTTLIGTIYELARRGMLDEYGFAGSETLRGLEERCHLARLASDAPKPDTERTQRWAHLSFAHLKLNTPHGLRDVVFSDRSGEHFDKALDTPGDLCSFAELERADQLWLVVDLAQLSNTPDLLVSQLRQLVMGLKAAGLLTRKSLALVATKSDLLSDPETETRVRERVAALKHDLDSRSGSDSGFAVHFVASRVKPGTTEIGIGLSELVAGLWAPEADARFKLNFPTPANPSILDRLVDRIGTCA